jgi:hypothetical protein
MTNENWPNGLIREDLGVEQILSFMVITFLKGLNSY